MIERVIHGMADFDELTMPSATVKKAPQPEPIHHTKPGPDHPWHRPFKVHIDRG